MRLGYPDKSCWRIQFATAVDVLSAGRRIKHRGHESGTEKSDQYGKVAFFVMALPHSDASFVMAFERECTETFWEGHVRAFEFFGACPGGSPMTTRRWR